MIDRDEPFVETRKKIAKLLNMKEITIRSWRFQYANGTVIADTDRV